MQTVTLQQIMDREPCGQTKDSKEGWDLLTTNLGTSDLTTEITYLQILESNGLEDAIWALRCDPKLSLEFAIICAEHVLDVFEKWAPGDSRVRKSLEASRAYLENPTQAARAAGAAGAVGAAGAAGAAEAAEAAWAARAAGRHEWARAAADELVRLVEAA